MHSSFAPHPRHKKMHSSVLLNLYSIKFSEIIAPAFCRSWPMWANVKSEEISSSFHSHRFFCENWKIIRNLNSMRQMTSIETLLNRMCEGKIGARRERREVRLRHRKMLKETIMLRSVKLFINSAGLKINRDYFARLFLNGLSLESSKSKHNFIGVIKYFKTRS